MKTTSQSKKFQRKKEDFICGHCGFLMYGNGYTNHCQKCLWSKHVDVYPGDRAAGCNGMMEPTGVEVKKGEQVIVHTCVRCGYVKKNKASKDDSFDVLLKLLQS
ncbi:RNHCP domain-containing protein [Candidatus Uhrbacteria bacterium]|nr:RNHCP domain-containing protein [Candidatus Uhrbacteria bacterium]